MGRMHPTGWRRFAAEVGPFAELLALCGVVFTLPILDSFASGTDIFVYRRVGGLEVVAFALIVALGPALVLFLIELLVGLASGTVRRWTHLGISALLVGVAGWQLVERHSPLSPARTHLLVASGLAGLGGWVLFRFEPVRTWLRLLALIPVAATTLWLTTGPVEHIAFAQGLGTVEGLPVGNPVPVVVLVLDEVPTASLLDGEGLVDETLWPNFGRLARDATWYRNHSTVSPTTPEAVPAILTGLFPVSIGEPPTSEVHPDNLFTALQGAYRLNVWEGNTQLCPPDLCPARGGAEDQGMIPILGDAVDLWTRYMDEPPPTEAQDFAIRQSDPDAPDLVHDFIEAIEPTDGPRLDFLHTLFPHQPWHFLPSGSRHDAPFLAEGLTGTNYAWGSEELAEAGRQRHLLQLQYADTLLGELLDRLEETDRYEDALVVVTADHGVSFTVDQPIRGLGSHNAEQMMWSPLFVKLPGQSDGRIDDRPTQSVDILPTIADVLDVELPWQTDGRSVLEDRDDSDEDRRLYPWRLNDLEPGSDGYTTVDGSSTFPRLFDVEPAGSEPRDDLQLYRFGRWGRLTGTEVGDLRTGEPAGISVVLRDEDGEPVGPEHFDVDFSEEVLPVYVRGTFDGVWEGDVLVTVNGFVAGWSEPFEKKGEIELFVLAPQQLFAEGANRIELYGVAGQPDDPVLSPITIDWGP